MSIDMNTTINGGSVRIEDGLKAKEEYAPARKVAVELSFSVPEGQDGTTFLNHVTDIINAKVAEQLGGAAAPKTRKAALKPADAGPAPKTTAPELSDKDKLAAAAGLPVGLNDELTGSGPAPAAKPATVPVVEDSLDDMLGDSAPVPVTDAELAKAAQTKNAAMKDKPNWAPQKIRDLTKKFDADHTPPMFKNIPAAKRHEFLKELDALT